MALKKRSFGVTAAGVEVFLYTLENSKGMKAEVTNYGANLVNLLVPDANGEVADVVLGFDSVEGYMVNGSFFGATIGPSANRIGGAAFTIDGVEYTLAKNNGANNLHSDGFVGYHKQIWEVEEGENSVTFTIADADGNMGFPGNKKVQVTYTLTNDNELKLTYHVSSDKKTFYHYHCGYQAGSSATNKDNDSNYFVYQIDGLAY